jgi:hypothetical protein
MQTVSARTGTSRLRKHRKFLICTRWIGDGTSAQSPDRRVGATDQKDSQLIEKFVVQGRAPSGIG